MTNFKAKFSSFLPARSYSVHKYNRGRVAIVAGSEDYPGAAILAARGAARAGAGYVNLFVPEPIVKLCQAALPSIVVRPLCEETYPEIAKAKCMVAGPGLGSAEKQVEILEELLTLDLPTVIDADLIKNMTGLFKKGYCTGRTSPIILTPHRGELKDLLKNEADLNACSGEEIAKLCQAWIDENRAEITTIVAKGASTYIVGTGDFLDPTCGTDTLATAGSGDVLAGTIGGILAQTGMQKVKKMDRPNFVASVCASCVEIHALAGMLAAEKFGHRGVMATDLANFIGIATDELYSATK